MAFALGGVFFGRLLEDIGWSSHAARLSALLFAFAPSVIAFSSVVSSEAPLIGMLGPATYLFFRRSVPARSRRWDLSLSSLLFGLAYLSIPTGALMFAGHFALLLVFDPKERCVRTPAWQAMVPFLVPFLLLVALQTGLNRHYDGAWSPSPSPFGIMGLLLGTSLEGTGRYDPALLAEVGYIGENRVSMAEADRRALDIVFDRLRSQPIGVLKFALSTKISELWREEGQLLTWSLRESPQLGTETSLAHLRVLNGYYWFTLLLLVPAMALLWRHRPLGPPFLAIGLGLFAVASLHVLLTIQQRYHLIFMPFVYGANAWLIDTFLVAWARSDEDESVGRRLKSIWKGPA